MHDEEPPQIRELSLAEAVRARPTMYFGVRPLRFCNLLQAVFAEVWKAAIDGTCRHARVGIREDGSFRVADDGRPFASTRGELEALSIPPPATKLRCTGQPLRTLPGLRCKSVPCDLPLFGGFCVEPAIWAAVSKCIEVECVVDGARIRRSLQPEGEVESLGPNSGDPLGSALTIHPDPEIIGPIDDVAIENVRAWLRTRAILAPGFCIHLATPGVPSEVMHYPRGIAEHFERRLRESSIISPSEPFRHYRLVKSIDGISAEVLLWWDIHSRVNEVVTNGFRTVHEGEGGEAWAQAGPFSRGLRAGIEQLHHEPSEGSPPPAGANFIARLDIDTPNTIAGALWQVQASNSELYRFARDLVVEQLPGARKS